MIRHGLDMEGKGATLEELLPVIAGEKSREAMSAGDIDNSLLPCGQVVGLVHEITSIGDVIKGLVDDIAALNASSHWKCGRFIIK